MPVGEPFIPRDITVHLGRPEETANNVTVSFPDYIKNVVSSEIYPTWPENAIRANIYVIVSFALNRVYTEWYRSRGYPFDITNSTQFDQKYIYGREIFETWGSWLTNCSTLTSGGRAMWSRCSQRSATAQR